MLVVVIVGAVIALIVGVTASDGPKPATPKRDRKRGGPARHPERPRRSEGPAPIARNAPVRGADEPPGRDPEVAEDRCGEIVDLRRSFGERVRALSLLAVTVLTLGSVAAALLGAIVLAGARIIDRALG
ncbi:MAG: hypothetical protein Q8K58_13295 [Acidimicrobiales bacterium]|nr:hypothetical protein [Acidimicrobiales bacterium]